MRTPSIPPEFRAWKISDGVELHGRVWPPTRRAPNQGFLYLHGIQSHGGWFEWSAALLAGAGGPVLLPDRRGSGLNQAARGDTPSAERWLEDLDELSDWTRDEFGVRRLAVVGVSWGGKLAVAWALQRPERVGRLLLIAPGLFPAVDVGFMPRLRIVMSLRGNPQRKFAIPLNDPTLFTNNPAGQAFIASDPLKLTHATARFYYESRRLDRILRSAAPGALQADATLLLATRDRIIRNAPTTDWLERFAARPVSLHTFPGAAHTLEFEPDASRLERLLIDWARGFPPT